MTGCEMEFLPRWAINVAGRWPIINEAHNKERTTSKTQLCVKGLHNLLTDNYLVEAGRTLRYRELTREDNRFKATLSIEVMICDIQTKVNIMKFIYQTQSM